MKYQKKDPHTILKHCHRINMWWPRKKPLNRRFKMSTITNIERGFMWLSALGSRFIMETYVLN